MSCLYIFITKTKPPLSGLTESGLRKTAFDIMTKSNYEFKEITAEEFEIKRMELLNYFKSA